MITKPLEFFNENRAGDLNSRFGADLSQIQDAFTTNIAFFLRQLLIIIFGIAAIFWTSFELAKLMLITIPVVMIIAVIFGRFIKKLSKEVQDKTAKTNTIVDETIQGIVSVKSYVNEAYELMREHLETVADDAFHEGCMKANFYAHPGERCPIFDDGSSPDQDDVAQHLHHIGATQDLHATQALHATQDLSHTGRRACHYDDSPFAAAQHVPESGGDLAPRAVDHGEDVHDL